jgi:Signal transduction histidine kinase
MPRPSLWTPSLSRRLLLVVALSMVAAMVFVVYSVLREADHEAEEVLDAWQFMVASDLLRNALIMIREERLNDAWLALETTRGLENSWLNSFSTAPGLLFLGEQEKTAAAGEREKVAAYIWLVSRGGKILLGKPMPDFREDWEGPGRRFIRTLRRGDHEWRIVSVMDEEGRYRIFVAQRDDLRTYIAREIGNHLLHIQLIVIPLVMVALWLGIWRGLRPLSRLSRQIASRQPGNLQPVPLKGVPREVLPVVGELNRLLERLRVTLESERAFTANAAHELRNPLAAMRNLGRVVSEGRDLDEVRRCGQLLERSMERMSALLSQLLHLARLDASVVDRGDKEASLREAVERCVAESIALAEARGIEIAYQARLEACLKMDPGVLQMLLANLLSNALKYGRPGGKVVVRAKREQARLKLEVLDDGPGVPEEQLPRLFERFYRTSEAALKAEGTGLGLAIVWRIAELHEADVWAENRRRGGLKVTVSFPPSRWRRVE